MIADGVCEVLDRTMHYEYDRHSQRKNVIKRNRFTCS